MWKNANPVPQQSLRIVSIVSTTSTSAAVDSNTDSGSVVTKIITIHSSLDVTILHQDYIYRIQTARGHYLLWSLGINQLLYDGIRVYGPTKFSPIVLVATALSNNGLHYAYVTMPDGYSGKNYVYVDGQLVASDTNIFGLSVTDDGKHYFYASSNSPSGFHGGNLIKDGIPIFTAQEGWGIQGFSTNSDGSQYFLMENATGNSEWVDILNGQKVFDGSPLAQPQYSFSPDFQNYGTIVSDESIATGTWTLSVDGKVIKAEVGTNVALGSLAITNSRHYAFTDENGDNIWVDNIPHHYSEGDGVGHSALINEDGSHYLIEPGGGIKDWNLDGGAIHIDDPINTFAELVGDVLYLYKVVQ